MADISLMITRKMQWLYLSLGDVLQKRVLCPTLELVYYDFN